MLSELVWLITGTSEVTKSLQPAISKVEDLKAKGVDILELDVTVPLEDLHDIARFMAESTSLLIMQDTFFPEETLNQFHTKVFGALNTTRAVLPYMREKKTGTIVFLGSIGGWRSVTNAGIYAATKFTLRVISETLHAEISSIGLRSTCIDPGHFRTHFLKPDHRAPPVFRIADYKPVVDQAEAALQAYQGKQPGDPLKGVEVIVDLVRGEGVAAGKPFPTTLSLGSDYYNVVKASSEATLARLEAWKDVSISTDFQ